jgi:hypothetical protein
MQPESTAPPLSYLIGVVTHIAESGMSAILAELHCEDDPKMESMVLARVVASHRRFEYLE